MQDGSRRTSEDETAATRGSLNGDVGLDARQGFNWKGREEVVVYALAIVSYVGLGVLLRTVVLNWIVGPLYFLMFVWTSALVIEKVGARRR